MSHAPITLAVLASGAGSTLQNLIDRIADRSLNADIAIVVASRADCGAVDRAGASKIPTHIVDRKAYSHPAPFAERVFELIDDASVDLVCMAGWFCFTPIAWRYEHRVMNIHPSLLPAFGGHGMWGNRVHEAVLTAKPTESGCTVHFVDDVYDHGPIILQRKCAVLPDDSIERLQARVAKEEAIAYPEAIRLFAEGRVHFDGKRVVVK